MAGAILPPALAALAEALEGEGMNGVEIAELADHPYMVGSQFHPEFKSRPTQPHPLFLGLIQAALAFQEARQQWAEAADSVA